MQAVRWKGARVLRICDILLVPSWMLEQELQRHLEEYQANDRELQERLSTIRHEKEKNEREMKGRARYKSKKQVR